MSGRKRRLPRLGILGYGVIGIFLMPFVLVLQPTPGWFFVALVPSVILIFLLRRRHWPSGSRRLAVGVFLTLSCVIALARAYTASFPVIPETTPGAVLEWSHGDAFLASDWYTLEDVAEDNYVLFYRDDEPINIELHFEGADALEGRWGFRDAQVVTKGTLDVTVDVPDLEVNWGDELDDNPRPIYPYMEFELPLDETHTHERLALRAQMRLLYPQRDQGIFEGDNEVSFYDEEILRVREFTVFVGTPEELELRRAYNRTRGLNEMMTDFPGEVAIWVLLASGIVVAGWGARTADVRGWRGMAPPIRQAQRYLVLRAVQDVLNDLAAQTDAPPPNHGVFVAYVAPTSHFAASGLRPGQVILEADQVQTHRPKDVFQVLGWVRNQKPIPFVIWEDGVVYRVDVNFFPSEKAKRD